MAADDSFSVRIPRPMSPIWLSPEPGPRPARMMLLGPYRGGPRVRILLSPPASRLRTGLPPRSTFPASPSERDRGFESLFLHRRVHCEADSYQTPIWGA